MNDNDLLEKREGPVLTLTLNRPEQRNAMSPAILAGLAQKLSKVPEGVRLIVLTGAGDKAFCAGADLQTGKSFQFDHSQPRAPYADLLRIGHSCAVPVLGRINGTCVAGGMGLLGLCDLAIAADHGKFGLPEVKVGVFPMQVLAVLRHLVPYRKLVELCLTGELVSAAEAQALGLVNQVVPAAGLDAAVNAMAEKLLSAAPSAIRRGKYAMAAIEAMSFDEAISFLEAQIGAVALTEDAKEGMAAFREKRKPQWPGR